MMQSTTSSPNSSWMLDSGASNHYTSNKEHFMTFENTAPIPIETASTIVYGYGKGDIVLHLTCGTIRISDVIYVPSMNQHTNLLSIGQLEAKGIEFTFKSGRYFVCKTGGLWATATRRNNVYVCEEINSANSMVSYPAMSSPKDSR